MLLTTLAPDVVVTLPHLFPNVREVVRLGASAKWKLVYAPLLHEDDPYWSIDQVSQAVTAADGVVALTNHEERTAPRVLRRETRGDVCDFAWSGPR